MSITNSVDLSKLYNILGTSLDYLVDDYKKSIAIQTTPERIKDIYYIIQEDSIDEDIVSIPVIVDSFFDVNYIFYENVDYQLDNINNKIIILNPELLNLDLKFCPVIYRNRNLFFDKWGSRFFRKELKNYNNINEYIRYLHAISIEGPVINKIIHTFKDGLNIKLGDDFVILPIPNDIHNGNYRFLHKTLNSDIIDKLKNNLSILQIDVLDESVNIPEELITDLVDALRIHSPINSYLLLYTQANVSVDTNFKNRIINHPEITLISDSNISKNINDNYDLFVDNNDIYIVILQSESLHNLKSIQINNTQYKLVLQNKKLCGNINQVIKING